MKTKLGLLVLALLLLLSGCDAIFDTLIEAVYKDQIDENKFGEVEVPVTIWVGDNWPEATERGHPLKLALVPYYSATGGIFPNWEDRIERTLDWNSLNEEFGSSQGRFVAYLRVQKGYANWRLFVWQPRSGDYSRIVAGFAPAGDPSKMLSFNFNTGGSSDVLDDENLNSRPGVDYWFYPSDRAPEYILDQLYGTGSAEFMDLSGRQDIDENEAMGGGTYDYWISRYGSVTFKRVREIQVQRRNLADFVMRRSWEPDWITIAVPDWQEYSGDFQFVLGFDNLYLDGNPLNAPYDFNSPLKIEARLVYEDGGFLTANPSAIEVAFGNNLPAFTPFRIDCSATRPDYASSLIRFLLYDENWEFRLQIDSNLVDGYIAFEDFRGYPSYSSVAGAHYWLRVIVDTNGDSGFGGYNNGSYDQYTDKELVVNTDSSYYDSSYGWVYIGSLSFTSGDYWYSY